MERPKDRLLVESLNHQLLESWNKMDAMQFASLFAENGSVIGFDGSQANGRHEIEAHLAGIFANHTVASYIGIIKEIRFFSPEIAILRAVAGMVPPGQYEINPKTNAVQTVVVRRENKRFAIETYQNTPAAFHGRPELTKQLTEEVRSELQKRSAAGGQYTRS